MLVMPGYTLPLREPSKFKAGKSHFRFEGACVCKNKAVTGSHVGFNRR